MTKRISLCPSCEQGQTHAGGTTCRQKSHTYVRKRRFRRIDDSTGLVDDLMACAERYEIVRGGDEDTNSEKSMMAMNSRKSVPFALLLTTNDGDEMCRGFPILLSCLIDSCLLYLARSSSSCLFLYYLALLCFALLSFALLCFLQKVYQRLCLHLSKLAATNSCTQMSFSGS